MASYCVFMGVTAFVRIALAAGSFLCLVLSWIPLVLAHDPVTSDSCSQFSTRRCNIEDEKTRCSCSTALESRWWSNVSR